MAQAVGGVFGGGLGLELMFKFRILINRKVCRACIVPRSAHQGKSEQNFMCHVCVNRRLSGLLVRLFSVRVRDVLLPTGKYSIW